MEKLQRCSPEEEELLDRLLILCLMDKEGTRDEQEEIQRKLEALQDEY